MTQTNTERGICEDLGRWQPYASQGVVQSPSHVWLFVTPWTAAHRPSDLPPPPGVCSNSSPLSQWCHPIISSSAGPLSSCLQSFPASGSFPMSQFFTSVDQRIGASPSSSVFAMNIQGWSPLGLTDLIFLFSEGLSRVFSKTLIRKHQFFGTQRSLWSNPHIERCLLEKP